MSKDNGNFVSRAVFNGVGNADRYAGNVVGGVGNGVSGIGRNDSDNVTKTTLGWADGTQEYANGMKDATRASGPRSQTSNYPLGLAKTSVVGKEQTAKNAASK
ncbi:MAG: hypothetical protein M1827_000865 [Pycnora praestabilis]|nr:MAG: hypothetical protein M1827_000865 [Pycnora praestabilis]